MLSQIAAIVLAAAAPWTPERGATLEADAFTTLRGTAVRDDAEASGGRAVEFTARDGQLGLTFSTVPGTHVWSLRCKAKGGGSDSALLHLDGRQLRSLFAPKKRWGEAKFEFRIDEPGEHTMSLTLRESPGFSVDWLRLDAGPVLKLKPLFVRTPIAEGGRPLAMVVAPSLAAYDPLVHTLVDAVRTRTGAQLPVRRGRAASKLDKAQWNLIALGTVDDGELIRSLYGWGYVRCGPRSPGPGGYVVETVHDPFGTGKNVVVVAASDLAGVVRAVARLCELVPAKPSAALEHVLEVVETKRGLPVAPKPEYIAYEKGRMAKWLRQGGERRLAKTSIGYGGSYYRTGQPEWLGLFLHGLYQLQDHMRRRNKLDLGFRDAWLYRLIRTWDLVEEMPGLSDADRLRITNFILDLVRDCRKVGYFRKMRPGELRWNHQTVPALGMLWAGEYFGKYYGLPEAQDWTALARMCFEPQLQAFKPLEDAQAYQWGTLSQVITYTHASGDYTYFQSNNARRSAELAYMTLDNLGYVACFGDHGASPNASHVPQMAGWADWFYSDPRFAWVAGPRSLGRAEPREPVDLIGTVAFPMHREVYRGVKEGRVRAPMPPTSPFERTFDKISFRSGFGPQNQYMLLDGYSRGHHLHYDGNAIVRLTDRGRIWLHDSDYIRAMPKYHNAVTIVRDGQSMHIPPVCGLDLLGDFTHAGITQTSVRDYNGMDWFRSIVWLKDRFWLVVDDLVARQPAHYALQCYWRTLGDASIDGPTLHTVQVERALVARVSLPDASAGAAMRYEAADAYLVFNLDLKAGEHEVQLRAYGPNAAADSFHIDLDGERALTLGISVGKFGVASGRLKVAKPGQHALRVYLRESPGPVLDWVRVTPVGDAQQAHTVEAEDTAPPAAKPAQHFFVTDLSGSRLKLQADAETGRKYWSWYPYAEPVVKILHQVASVRLNAGERYSFVTLLQTTGTADKPTYLGRRVSQGAVLLAEAEHSVPILAGTDPIQAGELSLNAASYVLSGKHVALAGARAMAVAGRVWLSASSPVHLELDLQAGRCMAYAGADAKIALDLPGVGPVHVEGRGRHVLALPGRAQEAAQRLEKCLADLRARPAWSGGRTGKAEAQKEPHLKEQWSADAGSPVLCLAAADLDRDAAQDLVAGTLAGEVCAFGSNGEALWRFRTGAQVRSVAACDLEGDGRPEIVAGSDDCNVYALSAEGRKLWSFTCPQYRREGRVVTVFPADFDGDGKQEVIAGAENWHYFALDGQGRELWRFESVHGSTIGTAADLDRDGKQEVVMGTEYYWWRVVSGQGKLLWGASHGPHCTAVWAGDLDGDGKGEVVFGCADSNLYMHRPKTRHHTVWQQSLGEEVTDLVAVPGALEGQKLLVAAAESFNVFGVDAAGKVVWRRPFGDAARCLCTGDFAGDGRVTIGVGCDDHTVHVLDATGRILASSQTDGAPRDVVTLAGQGRPAWLAVGTQTGRVQVFSNTR